MDTSTKIKVQINNEADLDKLLERHPEITVNLSEKVTSAFVTKMRDEFGRHLKEVMSDMRWLLPPDDTGHSSVAEVCIKQDSSAPGGWSVSLGRSLQRAIRTEVTKLVRQSIDDKLSALTRDEIISMYRNGVSEVVNKAIALTNVDYLKQQAEQAISEKLAESISKTLVAEMLKSGSK